MLKFQQNIYSERSKLGTLSASIKTMSEKITENIEEINHQNHILKYDTLTNCINKDYFKQLVNKYIKDTKQNMPNAAMMIINIDNFRVINETMGYESGNMLLFEIAKRLFSNIINSSLLARTDGDEFTIFVEKVGEHDDITHKIDMIFSLFNTPFKVYNDEIFASISAGISLYPADGSYYEELFKNASSAINHVKLQKKIGYEFYQEQFNKMSREI